MSHVSAMPNRVLLIMLSITAALVLWAGAAEASWLGTTPADFAPKGPPAAIYELEIPASLPAGTKRLIFNMYSMDPNKRGKAIYEYWEKPDQAGPVIPWLIALLGDKERFGTRMRKVEVGLVSSRLLEELGGQAVPPLLKRLQANPEPYVQDMILDVLGKIRDPRSLDVIIGMSRGPDTFQEVKEQKLVQIKPSLEKPKAPPAPAPIRASAVKALRDFKNPKVSPALIAALSDPSPMVRSAAAEALTERGDAGAMEALMVAARDKHPEVRRRVMTTLRRYQDRRAVVIFIGGLKDEDTEVRRISAKALGYIRDERAAQPLLKAVNDPDPGVRVNAINSLQYYNNPAAVGPVAKALDDKNNGVRAKAALVLGPIGLGPVSDRKAVAALVKATKDVHPDVRRNAVAALKHVRDPRALDALLASCGDGHMPARVHAVNNLGFIKDPRATQALIKALKDPEFKVRLRAAEGLGRIKDKSAIKPLIDTLGDKERRVREAAADSLQLITGWRYGADQDGWRKWYKTHQ
jgi:HEAT repeat protein